MTDMNGKTVLVTGSVRGIGYGVAESFARAGARVGVHGLESEDEMQAACARLRAAGAAEVRAFRGNLAVPEEIDALMAEAGAWGPVDVLVNNAGIQHAAPFEEMPRAKWDAIIAVNLSAAFHTMQAVLPGMRARGYGRVINIASAHGLVASKEKAPYVAAKHGIVGLSKVAALEYAGVGNRASGGVTVNCIAPGWTETALIEPQIQARAEAAGGDRDAAIADLLAEKQPSQRMSDPSEIGALAVWLAAPLAHNVTGTTIPVDGGWTAQ